MEEQNLPLVIITHSLPTEWLAKLEGKCRTVIGPWDATHFDPSLEPYLAEAEGLFCLLTIPVREELLNRAPKLRVVSNMAVGYDNIDVAACTARRIPVGNTPGVLTAATADLTMALLLAAARQLPQASKDAREGRWITWSPAGWLGADLDGATLGVVGMGKIGRAVAQRAKGFGMKLLYTDIPLPPEVETELGAQRVELPELLRQSDFVTLHVPLTPETRGMIGEEQLRLMKPSAILVNTARGPVVQTAALLKALQEKWIAAAALDVTDPEPLPPDHPLYAQPNCLIVPHIASATHNTRRRMAELACDNLLAGLEGRRLPNCVNPEVYENV
ncbi:MAG: D-glycerate dehydrogenase [Anaerolineae bacterium]|jgi:glyoxylate reductase|nr:MAG: D-glycerate dehydrogenase [Anaerolineae bacterium]